MVERSRQFLHARRYRDRGASAVEFALVMPLLFALLLGVIQYGTYFWQRQGASAAAREGARSSAVGGWQCDLEPRVASQVPIDANTPGLAISRSFSGAAAEVGGDVTVKVSFPAMNLHMFPLPDEGSVVASATSRVESLGTPC